MSSDRVPKIIGSDFELANFVLNGESCDESTADRASVALLAEIDGLFAQRPRRLETHPHANGGDPDRVEQPPAACSLDWGRKFLPGNAGSYYIDSHHLEGTTPEVRSALDFVAVLHAMLRIARAALDTANERMPAGERIVCLATNSDGKGHSFGAHMNVSISRRAWNEMFERRLEPALFFLAAFQASSIVLTGQGKVGSENRRPWVPYQISRRADFIETMLGAQTMMRRPLLNSRDEPHTVSTLHDDADAAAEAPARLHCIFYDLALSHTSVFLRAGLLQIVLAMIEAGVIDTSLLLAGPIEALHAWSADPDLRTRAELRSGARVTAVEHQLLFLEHAHEFVAGGGCADIVQDADRILRVWQDALTCFEAGAWDVLARRFDWVRKRELLRQAMRANPALDWRSPEISHLDQAWGSLGDEGLYYACERIGLLDRLVTKEAVELFMREPPADTRAWARAMLLRSLAPEQIEEIDWSFIRIRSTADDDDGPTLRTIWLPTPHDGTADQIRRRRTAT